MWTEKSSIYTEKFDDEMGIFFNGENFPELLEHPSDVSGILTNAIKKLINEQKFGNIYIPEGIYPIKNTVKIPPSVRLIGYGENRPKFVVPIDGGNLGEPEEIRECDRLQSYFGGYPGAKYMFWFIGEKDVDKEDVRDANAGTFYSAISNIDFKIEGDHPHVICIRAHFAQHAFINHCHFDLGSGLAAMYDVGNEMEDLTVEGGEYGLICRMTSPGWPFVLLDSTFMNQRNTAILTTETGFTGLRLRILNTKRAFDLYVKESWEKLYLEDCVFVNISDTAISFAESNNVVQQTNLKDIYCDNVNVLIDRTDINKKISKKHSYIVREYTAGYTYSDKDKEPKFNENIVFDSYRAKMRMSDFEPISDIPELPNMTEWVNVKKYGAVGDGEADDTEAIQKALNNEKVLFFPQGVYHITDTITINDGNVLIGMSPISTQIVIKDDEPEFAGFGAPKAMLQTKDGANVIINGIGIDTLGKNPRAVGLKWTANEYSYVNDVKFLGGHGYMRRDGENAYLYLYNSTRSGDYDPDKRWDFQYASLWITNGGGGVFKDIWSCSPYAEAGIMVTNTSTPCKMYQVSLEHHVRHEIKFRNVSNFTIYGLQTEEEKGEGLNCLPMEIITSENLAFINYYLFRVVAVNNTFDDGVRIYDSNNIRFLNIHNKAQMQYVFPITVHDKTTGFIAKSSDYAKLLINGKKVAKKKFKPMDKICDGFDYIQGAAFDSKGNLYFAEKTSCSIYKYDVSRDTLTPVVNMHFIPSAVAFDTKDNMLVCVDYSELLTTKPGTLYQSLDLTNFHPFFSWFKKRSEKMYACNPERPYETMEELSVGTPDLYGKTIIRPGEFDYPGMFNSYIDKGINEYYIAPDKETIIEKTVDLARCVSLTKYKTNGTAIITDDARRRTYRYKVNSDGSFTDRVELANRGQYGTYMDSEGILWTVEDRLYGFKDGKIVKSVEVPFDAHSVTGYMDKKYIIGRHGVYVM